MSKRVFPNKHMHSFLLCAGKDQLSATRWLPVLLFAVEYIRDQQENSSEAQKGIVMVDGPFSEGDAYGALHTPWEGPRLGEALAV